MKNLFAIFVFSLTLPIALISQEKKDPFDLSALQEKLGDTQILTVDKVKSSKEEAYQLFEQGKWKEAAESLHTFAKQSNSLANIISAGLEPFYGASYDDRKDFPSSKSAELWVYETVANNYKKERNKAMVMEAECNLKLGNKQQGIALLVNSLDLINIDNQKLWDRAKDDLYDAIGLKEKD